MKIKVTKDDINEATRSDPNYCMVARAIQREVNIPAYLVEVGYGNCDLCDNSIYSKHLHVDIADKHFEVDPEIASIVRQWDNEDLEEWDDETGEWIKVGETEIQPFEFDLPFEEGQLSETAESNT